eukprot:238029-Chlamydomonas_euryale.AAC.1
MQWWRAPQALHTAERSRWAQRLPACGTPHAAHSHACCCTWACPCGLAWPCPKQVPRTAEEEEQGQEQGRPDGRSDASPDPQAARTGRGTALGPHRRSAALAVQRVVFLPVLPARVWRVCPAATVASMHVVECVCARLHLLRTSSGAAAAPG